MGEADSVPEEEGDKEGLMEVGVMDRRLEVVDLEHQVEVMERQREVQQEEVMERLLEGMEGRLELADLEHRVEVMEGRLEGPQEEVMERPLGVMEEELEVMDRQRELRVMEPQRGVMERRREVMEVGDLELRLQQVVGVVSRLRLEKVHNLEGLEAVAVTVVRRVDPLMELQLELVVVMEVRPVGQLMEDKREPVVTLARQQLEVEDMEVLMEERRLVVVMELQRVGLLMEDQLVVTEVMQVEEEEDMALKLLTFSSCDKRFKDSLQKNSNKYKHF